MGDEMKYSEGQRNQIYEKYLRPLKLKISQILLYDTNAAADFLNKYNNLLQKTSDSELLDKITELELEIEQYEKTLGKEKNFQDKSSIIIGQVEELLNKFKKVKAIIAVNMQGYPSNLKELRKIADK